MADREPLVKAELPVIRDEDSALAYSEPGKPPVVDISIGELKALKRLAQERIAAEKET